MDPVLTVLAITRGSWATQTFEEIPRAESFITVENGNPGFTELYVIVNSDISSRLGKNRLLLRLKPGEVKALDVSSAMIAGNNVITFGGHGKPGADAVITVADSPSVTVSPSNSLQAAPKHQSLLKTHREHSRHYFTWGKITEDFQK